MKMRILKKISMNCWKNKTRRSLVTGGLILGIVLPVTMVPAHQSKCSWGMNMLVRVDENGEKGINETDVS